MQIEIMHLMPGKNYDKDMVLPLDCLLRGVQFVFVHHPKSLEIFTSRVCGRGNVFVMSVCLSELT